MRIKPKFGSRRCRRVGNLLGGAPHPAYEARIGWEWASTPSYDDCAGSDVKEGARPTARPGSGELASLSISPRAGIGGMTAQRFARP